MIDGRVQEARRAAALVQRARAGDVDAFACLAAEHQAALSRFCRRLMGDASAGEDLCQETLLRAQQSVTRLGEPYRFGPWLMGIAANLAKKAWRRAARHPLSLEQLASTYPEGLGEDVHAAIPGPEEASEEAEDARVLLEAIGTLPPSLGRVVVLHYLNGLNYTEVAGALDVPVSTVKGRLFESRARLRRRLADANPSMAATRVTARATAVLAAAGNLEIQTTGDATAMEPQRAIRVEVHLDAVIDEAYRFVSAKWPRPHPRATLGNLAAGRILFPVEVLEQMVLAGAGREDVAEFLTWCFNPEQFDVR